MEMEIDKQVHEMDELAAFLRSEIRRLETDLRAIPRQLSEKIEMLRRIVKVINKEHKRFEEVRKKFRAKMASSLYSSTSNQRPSSGSGQGSSKQ